MECGPSGIRKRKFLMLLSAHVNIQGKNVSPWNSKRSRWLCIKIALDFDAAALPQNDVPEQKTSGRERFFLPFIGHRLVRSR